MKIYKLSIANCATNLANCATNLANCATNIASEPRLNFVNNMLSIKNVVIYFSIFLEKIKINTWNYVFIYLFITFH